MIKKNIPAANHANTPGAICDLIRFAVTEFEQAELFYGHGTDNAFDEAVFMVTEYLRLPPERLEAFWNARLTDAEIKALIALFGKRIKTRKPASYLLNKAYIQGLSFYVDERVIVPRSFIAEILCGEMSPISTPDKITRVLDLCTGSGCLAILAARLFPNATVDAVDLSKDALAVAKRNVQDYALQDRIKLYQGDLFKPLPKTAKYDLIISNPPYVDAGGMKDLPKEFKQEPAVALDGGRDGLKIVRQIVDNAAMYLDKNGMLICEIGRTAEALHQTFPSHSFSWLETENSQGEVFFITRKELAEHA